MKKVAIVGVEGSGKTVMLAGLGELYAYPDTEGYFLSPQDFGTASYVAGIVQKMRAGAWPSATSVDALQNLNWVLKRKKNSRRRPDAICELAFLDFAGEVYRCAFGAGDAHGDRQLKEQAEALKTHLRTADEVIVLVNLCDVIRRGVADRRTQEAMWVTKGILDVVSSGANGRAAPRAAIVLSQADRYADTIKECGGAVAVLGKYLPHVANDYDGLDIFDVKAVDRTVQDADGHVVPAKDFTLDGLRPIMEWILKGPFKAEKERSRVEDGARVDDEPRGNAEQNARRAKYFAESDESESLAYERAYEKERKVDPVLSRPPLSRRYERVDRYERADGNGIGLKAAAVPAVSVVAILVLVPVLVWLFISVWRSYLYWRATSLEDDARELLIESSEEGNSYAKAALESQNRIRELLK